jgi:hypothetical protein
MIFSVPIMSKPRTWFSLTFECLSDTPKSMKNALYSTKTKRYTDLQRLIEKQCQGQ